MTNNTTHTIITDNTISKGVPFRHSASDVCVPDLNVILPRDSHLLE